MNFQEFLNKGKSVKGITKKIVVGDRFKDESGKDFYFTIKTLSAEQLDRYRNQARGENSFNADKFNIKVVIEGCKYPNFKDVESIKLRGCHNAEEYIKDVLLPGEIDIISLQVQKLCGYNVSVNELIEEAKN